MYACLTASFRYTMRGPPPSPTAGGGRVRYTASRKRRARVDDPVVLVVGAPDSGKSSLANLVLGRELFQVKVLWLYNWHGRYRMGEARSKMSTRGSYI